MTLVNFPARLAPIPPDKIDGLLPEGDVLTVRRVYPAAMQPDSISKWHRSFFMERVKLSGAFYSAPLRGSDAADTTIGVPMTDGGFLFVVNPAKPKEPVDEKKQD